MLASAKSVFPLSSSFNPTTSSSSSFSHFAMTTRGALFSRGGFPVYLVFETKEATLLASDGPFFLRFLTVFTTLESAKDFDILIS